MSRMPELDLSVLTPAERELAAGILATRGENAGRLRASKPKVTREDLGPREPGSFYHNWRIEGGETAYIWRMVAFHISPISQHHCMPVMAEADLPGDTVRERGALAKELDAIVDKLVNAVPLEQWHGVARWRQALSVGRVRFVPKGE